jgi:hypothetical protein
VTSKISELFGVPTALQGVGWKITVARQHCPYLDRKCLKNRKSQPDISIGSCTVEYGDKENAPVIICPHRLLERKQIFMDCLHLLTLHEPGNEYHVVAEITLPGGSVDYFLISSRDGKVKDFVGIELQTLDTTGTVWPARQRFLKSVGLPVEKVDANSDKGYGMNWKMTAKTTLVQLHHKVQTFEHLSKHLVLVIQDHLLRYMQREFSFGHLRDARLGDPMHFHSYSLERAKLEYKIKLDTRLSTDAAGIAKCLGLQAEANLELAEIITLLEAKISKDTLLTVATPPPTADTE